MSNTTSHILLLIQCVLEIKAVFGYYFQKKKIFVSCVCNWILFSEKKIFVSCVCNWVYNQIYSNVVSVFIGYIYLGYSCIQLLPKFLAKTFFGINNAGNKKKTITGSLMVCFFLLTTRLEIKMHTIFLIILTLVEFSSSKKINHLRLSS